jgi:hypothetical protein
MPQNRKSCYGCEHLDYLSYQGAHFPICGHKYGPDQINGNPGFVDFESGPPWFCPLATLQGDVFVSMDGHEIKTRQAVNAMSDEQKAAIAVEISEDIKKGKVTI